MGVHLISETGELFKKIYRLYHIFVFVFFPSELSIENE